MKTLTLSIISAIFLTCIFFNSFRASENSINKISPVDSAVIYQRQIIRFMNLADRSTGELKTIFEKKYNKAAIDLDMYNKTK